MKTSDRHAKINLIVYDFDRLLTVSKAVTGILQDPSEIDVFF